MALYAEVDALLSPITCDQTTECCRFGITGREPYPTPIEFAEMQRAMQAAGGIQSPKRRLPMRTDDGEGRCPLLTQEGRCRIYASRPFGCRTHFCHRVEAKLPRREIQRWSRAILDLSEAFAPQDPRPRPLRSWLETRG